MAGELPSDGISDLIVILAQRESSSLHLRGFASRPIIGFILVGILVGPMGLGALVGRYPALEWFTITNPEAITPIGEYGIILLLFSIGLELSFRRLWKMRRLVFGVGAAQLFGAGLHHCGWAYMSFGYGVTAATGHWHCTRFVVNRAGAADFGHPICVGQSALAMLLFEDLAIVPIIFVLGALAPQAGGAMHGTASSRALWQGGLVIIGDARAWPVFPSAPVWPSRAHEKP